MFSLRVVAFGFATLTLLATVRGEEPSGTQPPAEAEKRDYTSLIAGKWVRTDKYVGTTMEYARNGTYITSAAPKPGTKRTYMPGTWKIDGDRILQTLGPQKFRVPPVTIVKLTETEFQFRNHGGEVVMYERAAETKK